MARALSLARLLLLIGALGLLLDEMITGGPRDLDFPTALNAIVLLVVVVTTVRYDARGLLLLLLLELEYTRACGKFDN